MICGMIFFLFPSPEKMSQDYRFEPIEAIHWKDLVGKSKKRRAGEMKAHHICHSRESGNPGLVIKIIKYQKNGDEKIYYSTGFPLSRE